MARKEISKIKIKSTGKTYDVKPDGYDELYNIVCSLCDIYGLTRPSWSPSSEPEPDDTPTPTPTQGPELRNHFPASSPFKYNSNMGKIRIYDDSSFRIIKNNSVETDCVVPDDRFVIKSGGHQEPEVADLPVNVTIKNIKFNDNDYLLSGSENVLDKTSNSVVSRTYVDLPIDEYFNELGSHSFSIKYTDNYSLKDNSYWIYFSTVFNYDFAEGGLRIYDSGEYRIVSNEELTSGSGYTVPTTDGIFFKNLDSARLKKLYMSNQKEFFFDETESVIDYETVTPVTRRYTTILPSDFNGNLMSLKLYVCYNDSNTLTWYNVVSPYDSRVKISFKVNEITIDRTDPKSITSQMEDKLGKYLTDYITINIGEGVDYLPSGTDMVDQVKDKLYFYVKESNPVITVSNYYSTQTEDYEWDIGDCSWVKNASATINLSFCNRVVKGDDNEPISLTVRMVDEMNPGQVYVRRMNVNSYKIMYVNQVYKLRDLVTIVPSDGLFSDFKIVHNGVAGSVLDGTMDFYFKGDSSYFITNQSSTIPTNWDEFYDNFVTLIPKKTGQPRIYYLWRTTHNGGGGDTWVNVKNK